MQTKKKTALKILEQTSRTFYLPIIKLKQGLQQAVASTYLCLRAIDQIEDHTTIPNEGKVQILKNISYTLQKYQPLTNVNNIIFNWCSYDTVLPEVTLRLTEWIQYCPESIRARIVDCVGAMSDRMAFWVSREWKIKDEADLNAYTFSVAGAVGLILCELWEWFEDTHSNRELAVNYGRGLQSINILRNGQQDAQRGVSFYPEGWTKKQMIQYSHKNLQFGKKYLKSLPINSQSYKFCQIPLALAQATLNIIQNGLQKLTRQQVLKICKINIK